MKCSNGIILFLYIINVVITMPSTVTNAGSRIWNTVEQTQGLLDTIESKVDVLDNLIVASSIGTFTLLNAVLQKSCSLESIVDCSFTQVSAIDINLRTLNSLLDVVDNTVGTIKQSVDSIHINDFGGTWTAIAAIQETLCSKSELLLDNLDTIDSKIDVFVEQESAHFIATFTSLEAIADDVLDTLTEVQSINISANSQLDDISVMLQALKNKSRTICSRVDIVNTDLMIGFAGTFTALKSIENTEISIESAIDALYIRILSDSSGTSTSIDSLIKKIVTINSKVDVIDNNVSIVDRQMITIDSKADFFESKVCIVDSKVNRIDNRIRTTDSKVDTTIRLLRTIDSTLDIIDVSTIISKICTVDSKIDLINRQVSTIQSFVDTLIRDNLSIQSLVDRTDSFIDLSVLKVITVSSKVSILETRAITMDSKIDIFNSYVDIAQSKLDTLSELTIASKICRAESIIDKIDSTVDYLNPYAITINSKIDVVRYDVSLLDSMIDRVIRIRPTIESRVDVIDSLIDIALMKACTTISYVDLIDSKVDSNSLSGLSLNSRLDALSGDFQETWTALNVLNNAVRSVSNIVNTISSKIDFFIASPSVDFSGTFTALAALERKEITVQSKLDYANTTASSLSCISQSDLNGTYTMLDAITRKASGFCPKISSKIDGILDVLGSFGIPLFQSDVGTTGTTLSVAGRYFMTESIIFNPSTPGLAAITISANNVTLYMQRHTISQTGSTGSTTGIRLNNIVNTTYIIDGNIHDMTGNGIEVGKYNDNVFINGVNIADVGGNGIDFDISSTTIFIENTMVAGSGGDGINIDTASDVNIIECMLTDNGLSTTNKGVTLSNSTRVFVSYCMSTTNRGDGFHLVSTTTHFDTIVENCRSFENGGSGIYMARIKNSLIKGCMCSENASSGIEVHDCQYLDIFDNYCIDNRVDGIALATDSVGTNFCYVGGNSFLLTGSVNVHEKSGSGSNSILNNFALSVSGGDNFATDSHRTYMNFVTVDQSGTFPTTDLVKWYNVSMTT